MRIACIFLRAFWVYVCHGNSINGMVAVCVLYVLAIKSKEIGHYAARVTLETGEPSPSR